MRLNILLGTVLLCLAAGLQAQNQPAPAAGVAASSTNRPNRTTTLEECIQLALQYNLELQVTRFDPRLQRLGLDAIYGDYDPVFTAAAARSFSETEGGIDSTSGLTFPSRKVKNDSVNLGLGGVLPTGMRYDLGGDYSHTYGTQNGTQDSYDLGVRGGLTQPVLKDFWIDATRRDIKLGKRDIKISEQGLRLSTMQVVRDVQRAYYDLIAARDEVKVQEKAVETSRRLVAEIKRRVEVGTAAPLEEKQAEANAAADRANLILRRGQVLLRENDLKNLITDNYQQWHPLELVPAEALIVVPESASRAESWIRALESRPDFARAKLELEKQGINVQFGKNQLFPSLALSAGAGRLGRDDFFAGTPPGFTNRHEAGFNDALEDIDDGRNPTWRIGAVLSVPLTSRRERMSLRGAKESEKKLQTQLRQLHQMILAEVETAIITVQTTLEQIEARRQATIFAEAALDAEQKKLENGKSTSFQVLSLQRDLTRARSDEIAALAAYNKALSDFYFSEGSILERSKVRVE